MHMREVSKNKYMDKLDNVTDEYNNARRTIKMKSIDVKKSTYIDFDVKNSFKNSEFKVSYQVRMSKCKKFFAKVYTLNWSEENCFTKNF